MDENTMKLRTRQFGLRAIRMVEALPSNRVADILGRQLLRAATSVGANYRAACRAKSRAHMVSKLGDVEEEADESAHWIEMLIEAGLTSPRKAGALLREASELTAIMVASIKTLRRQQSTIQSPNSKFRDAPRHR